MHSPKFEHEADPDALAAAVERYAVQHPVLDDPDLVTWNAYTARAWPTLVVVDPEGYVVASLSGEGHAHGLSVLIDELVEEHTARGTLRRGDAPYVPPPPPSTALRFPGKAAALPDGSFLVSDTAHHQLVHLEPDLATERARIGGERHVQRAARRRSLCLPRSRRGSATTSWSPTASTTRSRACGWPTPGRDARRHGPAAARALGQRACAAQDLSTPWDLAWFLDRVVIAMAGTHQLWVLHLAQDPADNTVAVLAGTSAEGIRDGAAHDAWFAQPSGLAASADGRRLWVADSETSALRSLTLTGDGFEVTTHVGQGLFDFGHRDGAAGRRCCSTRSASPCCRRLGGGQRHLQRGHPPVRPGRPARSARWPRACASPATRSSRSTATRRAWWSWSPRPTS